MADKPTSTGVNSMLLRGNHVEAWLQVNGLPPIPPNNATVTMAGTQRRVTWQKHRSRFIKTMTAQDIARLDTFINWCRANGVSARLTPAQLAANQAVLLKLFLHN